MCQYSEMYRMCHNNYILLLHGPGSGLDSAGLLGKHCSALQCSEMAGKWSDAFILLSCCRRINLHSPINVT